MKKSIIIILICALSSCATVSKTYTASGQPAYSLNCSGTARGWDTCLKAAGDLCGTKGYNILDRNSEGTATAQWTTSGFFASQSNERSMLITCGQN